MNLFILVGITVIVNEPFSNSLKDRYVLIFKYPFGLFIYVITLFCTMIGPFIYKLIKVQKIEGIGEERSFKTLWKLNAFSDVMECIEYGIFESKIEVTFTQASFSFFFFCWCHAELLCSKKKTATNTSHKL